MQSKQTGEAYDDIAHLWKNDVFDHDNGLAQHNRSLAFVENCGTALDVGCGCNSRFPELLSAAGFEYEGMDVSAQMINLARQQNPHIVFYHEDICEWSIPKKYDFITAWDSIWHVSLELHEHVLLKMISALNPNGVLIFSFGGKDESGEHTNDLMGPALSYATLGTRAYIEIILSMGCAIKHLEYDQYPEPHAYIIVRKRAL